MTYRYMQCFVNYYDMCFCDLKKYLCLYLAVLRSTFTCTWWYMQKYLYLTPVQMLVPQAWLNPTHAFHGRASYFAFLCVCLSVFKITQKILNPSTSVLVEAFSLTQGENCSILRKVTAGKGRGGGLKKIWP